ncbi:MAG: hypothetical protein ACI82G_001695 [Bradymonadia bacterium]|jgi:hypothetical protein
MGLLEVFSEAVGSLRVQDERGYRPSQRVTRKGVRNRRTAAQPPIAALESGATGVRRAVALLAVVHRVVSANSAAGELLSTVAIIAVGLIVIIVVVADLCGGEGIAFIRVNAVRRRAAAIGERVWLNREHEAVARAGARAREGAEHPNTGESTHRLEWAVRSAGRDRRPRERCFARDRKPKCSNPPPRQATARGRCPLLLRNPSADRT